MTNSSIDYDKGLPKWFRLFDPSIDETDFNKLILMVLHRLDAEYPNRLDLSDSNKLSEKIEECSQIWGWLEKQEIVSGPMSNCSLTLSGRQSYRKAVQMASERTRLMLNSKDGLSGNEAKELMMNILRQHYYDYIVRNEEK